MKFTAGNFQPTKTSTAEDKARFANHFVKFVEGGYRSEDFPEWFYQRLSLCFGHIANYNRTGFFGAFFAHEEGHLRFLRQTAEHGCYGDPKFTYSDVERALRTWVLTQGLVEAQEKRLDVATEAKERAELKRLLAKYPDVVKTMGEACAVTGMGEACAKCGGLMPYPRGHHKDLCSGCCPECNSRPR